jgi:glycine reductase
MRLELDLLDIRDIRIGPQTGVSDGILYVSPDKLQSLLLQDKRLKSVDIDLAKPGESCRILQVADVIEPRVKMDGEPTYFSGALGKVKIAGEGRTRVLKGAAVVLNDQSDPRDLVEHDNPIGMVIDMSGPGADISLFGKTLNIVVSPQPAGGVSHDAYKVALKLAGLRTCVHLAGATLGVAGEKVEVYELPPLSEVTSRMAHLPKVVYNFQAYCTSYPGVPGEPILYGDNIRTLLPILIHPNEVLDGAVVNPYFGIGTETYVIQNHPVIKALYRRHGLDLCFVGVILTVSRYTEPERERVVTMVSNLVKSMLGADGIIITKSSSGAPDVDAAQIAHACEEMGVKAVLLMFDRSEGAEVGAVFNLDGARAIVATANQYQVYELPPVRRTIGRSVVLPDGVTSDGALKKPLRWIRGALDQQGHQRLRPVLY